MSEMKPKIVTITGEPWTEPPEPLENDEADEDLVFHIENLLAQAKSGALKGLVAIGWDVERLSYDQLVYLPVRGRPTHLEAAQFIGALTHTNTILTDLMLYGPVPDDEEFEDDE